MRLPTAASRWSSTPSRPRSSGSRGSRPTPFGPALASPRRPPRAPGRSVGGAAQVQHAALTRGTSRVELPRTSLRPSTSFTRSCVSCTSADRIQEVCLMTGPATTPPNGWHPRRRRCRRPRPSRTGSAGSHASGPPSLFQNVSTRGCLSCGAASSRRAGGDSATNRTHPLLPPLTPRQRLVHELS